jgi:hypothetical protein
LAGDPTIRRCLTGSLDLIPWHANVRLHLAASWEKRSMPQGKAVALGLNQTGLIVFILLIFLCLPICWLPFVIDSMKGESV